MSGIRGNGRYVFAEGPFRIAASIRLFINYLTSNSVRVPFYYFGRLEFRNNIGIIGTPIFNFRMYNNLNGNPGIPIKRIKKFR